MFVTSGNAAVRAQSIVDAPTTVPGGAPIGHLQPRAQQFAPRSAAEQTEQEEMSNFDAQQQKQDLLLGMMKRSDTQARGMEQR